MPKVFHTVIRRCGHYKPNVIITSRNKIRLSRHLHAQTTPYPNARRWFKTGIAAAVLVLVSGIYLVAKPRANSAVPAAPKEILGEQQKTVEFDVYTVKRGDTLFNVAATYGISWQTLAQINNLETPYILRTGQRLKIPTK